MAPEENAAPATVTSRWVYPLPQGNSLAAVWAGPGDTVFAVGNGGTIVRWGARERRFQSTQVGDADLWAVWGSEDGVYAAGERGTLLSSRDEGRSWQRVEVGSTANWWAGATCGKNVFVVGAAGEYLRSLDAGSSWQRGHVPGGGAPAAPLSSPYGRSDLTGVVCDVNGEVTAIAHAGSLLRSSDYGANWKRRDVEPAELRSQPLPERAHGLAFVKLLKWRDELLIVSQLGVPAPGENFPTARWTNVLRVRGDRVQPWHVARDLDSPVDRTMERAPLGTLSLATNERAAVLAADGYVYWAASDDKLWHPHLPSREANEIATQSELLLDVTGSADAFYAVGSWGYLLESVDGGRRWEPLRSPVDDFTALWSDENSAVALGQGMVLSADGGRTWTAPKKVAGRDLISGVAVWGEGRERYIAGTAGLFHSSDGGATFGEVALGLGPRARGAAVWGASAARVLVAAAAYDAQGTVRAGIILRGTASHFDSVLEQPFSPAPGRPRVFTKLSGNQDHRAYAGGVNGLLWRSVDDGATWERLPDLPDRAEVCGLHAGRADELWVLSGSAGCRETQLWASHDGGRSRSELASPRASDKVTAIGGSPMGELVIAAAGRLFEQDQATGTFGQLGGEAYTASAAIVAISATAPRRVLAAGQHGAILLVSAAPTR